MNALPLVAIVTGANRGIGLAVARQLAAANYAVILGSRHLPNGVAAQTELAGEGLKTCARQLDVVDPVSVERFFAFVSDTYGRLDVLVNNAATNFDFAEQAAHAGMNFAKATFDANLFGAWRMIQTFLPLLKKSSGGRIVNVSSGAGSFAQPEYGLTTDGGASTSYALSKLALNGLTTRFAHELRGTPILINAVCPGVRGRRTLAEAADGVIWAATLPAGGPSGKFFRDRAELPW